MDLDRQEYKGIGFVVFLEAVREFRDRQLRNPSATQPDKLVDVVSEQTRNHLLEDMARLEKGAQDSDKYKAAEAAEVLGYLQFLFLSDFVAAEKSAHRSIELDPKREMAWDLVGTCLGAAKDFRKLTDCCRDRLGQKDSARNRLMLAKAYEYLNQLDQAEEVIRVGLQRDPNDFMLRLALADLCLIRGDEVSLYLNSSTLTRQWSLLR